jgi:peptidoglycan glycosyltransferase
LTRRYLDEWTTQDYAGMYAMLSADSKANLTEAAFSADYADAVSTATQTRLRFGKHLVITDNLAEVPAAITTSTFGTLRETAHVQLSAGGKFVDFTPDMIFPGLHAGETLTRTSVLGKRGNLLASNGQLLADGAAPGGDFPALAGVITGDLGPIPSDERAYYKKLGYPADTQVGADGLEQIFQNELAGTPGGVLKAGTRLLATAAPVNGRNVKTTINPAIEGDAINALGTSYSGMIVLNEKTGGVEAAVGQAFTDLQPPGSTFKIITASAALQYGVAKLTTRPRRARSAAARC